MNTYAGDRPSRTARRLRVTGRGFTLIELMVALTGGLFFTIFVFMLSRDVSRFFQGQTRISESTLATVTGFERLRADIARAGFLSSPNLARDKNRCPRAAPGAALASGPQQNGTEWSALPGLQEMGLARIIETVDDDYADNYVLDENGGGLQPDKLVLYGNYSTAEQFPLERIVWGAPNSMRLKPTASAIARLGITAATSEADANAILRSVFRGGQILRLVDKTGREQYGIISDIAMDTSATPNVPVLTLANAPAFVRKESGGTCGIRSVCTDCLINPVDIIRYELVDATARAAADHGHTAYLYEGVAPAYDATRLDLYRYRLSPSLSNDADITDAVAEQSEVIAEYAVDLKFGLTALTDRATGVLTSYGEDAGRLQDYAGVPFESPTNKTILDSETYGPHFIRGISARLSVRNREADRDGPINPTASSGEQLFRVEVADGQFARMRSLRAHIATRNTQNLMWN